MKGFWQESNWAFDGHAVILPNGQRVTLTEIRRWREELYSGHFDLTSSWAGWRVRGYWLLPPGATMRRGRVSEYHLRRLLQYQEQLRYDGKRQLDLFP